MPNLNTDIHTASFNTREGMTMSSTQKDDEPVLYSRDIMGLVDPGAALMSGSMTLAPSNASVGLGQVRIYLRSHTVLSCKPFPHKVALAHALLL